MIFVILGTQDKQFVRLLQEIEKLIQKKIIHQKVVVQSGSTKYSSKNMEIHQMMPINQFLNYIDKSDYIITHGGVGSIIDALKKNKKIIAVPRLKKYGEHENDHQIQIIEEFSKQNYIIGCQNINQLKNAVLNIDTFEPKVCELGNKKMINEIQKFINQNNPSKRKNIMIFSCYTVESIGMQIIFYLLLSRISNQITAMWVSWVCAYLLLILQAYPKRKCIFEIIFGISIAVIQIIWLNLFVNNIWLMFLLTPLIAIVTYISHEIYYGGKK